jgi:hypothetical protein
MVFTAGNTLNLWADYQLFNQQRVTPPRLVGANEN